MILKWLRLRSKTKARRLEEELAIERSRARRNRMSMNRESGLYHKLKETATEAKALSFKTRDLFNQCLEKLDEEKKVLWQERFERFALLLDGELSQMLDELADEFEEPEEIYQTLYGCPPISSFDANNIQKQQAITIEDFDGTSL